MGIFFGKVRRGGAAKSGEPIERGAGAKKHIDKQDRMSYGLHKSTSPRGVSTEAPGPPDTFRRNFMDVYYAHVAPDGRRQTVLEHLTGTAERCRQFAAEFGAGPQGELAGLAHDIGKYSAAFQHRLEGGEKVDHATAGAFECLKRNQPGAAFCVAGHHGGLPDGGGRGDGAASATLWGRIHRAEGHGIPPYDDWKGELSLPEAAMPPFCGQDGLAASFFIRMLYSCLVDADFLDTEAFMTGKPARAESPGLSGLEERLEQHCAAWFPPRGELNRVRWEILEQCLQPAGLFTLTVPTGGGKTVASLGFALRHANKNHKNRVIYVIPYTSIIEQTAEVFRQILGKEAVLEHHANALCREEGELASTDQGGALLAAENWDAPVIVTTAVQFFESLYANRSSKCRKLHNLANSVIIFDEAQMLPLAYLRPCVWAIAQLVAHYGASAVLCTATQPALEPLFREFLPQCKATELCPPNLAGDGLFRRVTFHRAGKQTWEQLAEQMQEQAQCLCIVNSRKNAALLYQKLRCEGAFHLSTLMIPQHRSGVLTEIRRRLKSGEPCRVVSTSLIEAGVDVDFPSVFREEAGLDSILQAAGRCNREGRRPPAESVVTIFQAEEAPPPLFSAAIAAGRTAMERYADLLEQAAVSTYFQELRGLLGPQAQDRKNLLPRLSGADFPFRTVAQEMHLIENDTRTVYVPLEEGAAYVRQLREGVRSKALFRQLGRFSLSVYDRHFEELLAAGALEAMEDGSGVLMDLAAYHSDTGLILHGDSGQALFV